MDYSLFTKNIVLPAGVSVPTLLQAEGFYARPLTRGDIDADLAGVNGSIETIQKTRGGSWPTEQLSKEADLLDLAWHEREFNDQNSFAYVIFGTDQTYLGCFYLYGIGGRTPLNESTVDYEVDASWWVTTDAYMQGYYEKVYAALQQWLAQDFKFTKIAYSNKELPS